jgi:Lipid A core - O-antigen ligase and related enzymes
VILQGKHNTQEWVIYTVLIPLVLVTILWIVLHSTTELLVSGFFLLAGISWIISYYRLQVTLLKILVVLLPFSTELAIGDEFNVYFPSELLLAIIFCSLCWDFLRRPIKISEVSTQEDYWILPLVLAIAITTLFSTMLLVSVKFAIVSISYIAIFYIWQKHLFTNKPELFPQLLGLYSASAILVLVYSIIQFGNYEWNPITIRGIFKPFYKDNTIFGAVTALIASFWMAYSLKPNLKSFRIAFVVLSLVFTGAMILSTSRAAALSMVLFLITITILWFRVRLRYIAMAATLLLLVIVLFQNPIFTALQENQHQSHSSDFKYVEQLESSGNISSDISNIERLNRWTAGLNMFVARPITGFGPGTYQFAYIPYQKKQYMNRLTVKDPWHIPENSGGTAHSEYILAISEMGLLGFMAMLMLFFRWFRIAFSKARDHPRRMNIIIGFSVLSTYLFHAWFNNFLSTDKFAFLFWGTAAWMVSQYRIGYEQH